MYRVLLRQKYPVRHSEQEAQISKNAGRGNKKENTESSPAFFDIGSPGSEKFAPSERIPNRPTSHLMTSVISPEPFQADSDTHAQSTSERDLKPKIKLWTRAFKTKHKLHLAKASQLDVPALLIGSEGQQLHQDHSLVLKQTRIAEPSSETRIILGDNIVRRAKIRQRTIRLFTESHPALLRVDSSMLSWNSGGSDTPMPRWCNRSAAWITQNALTQLGGKYTTTMDDALPDFENLSTLNKRAQLWSQMTIRASNFDKNPFGFLSYPVWNLRFECKNLQRYNKGSNSDIQRGRASGKTLGKREAIDMRHKNVRNSCKVEQPRTGTLHDEYKAKTTSENESELPSHAAQGSHSSPDLVTLNEFTAAAEDVPEETNFLPLENVSFMTRMESVWSITATTRRDEFEIRKEHSKMRHTELWLHAGIDKSLPNKREKAQLGFLETRNGTLNPRDLEALSNLSEKGKFQEYSSVPPHSNDPNRAGIENDMRSCAGSPAGIAMLCEQRQQGLACEVSLQRIWNTKADRPRLHLNGRETYKAGPGYESLPHLTRIAASTLEPTLIMSDNNNSNTLPDSGKNDTSSMKERLAHVCSFPTPTFRSASALVSGRPTHPPPRNLPMPSSFAPKTCGVLDRQRYGDLGPEDRRAREPNSLARMRATVDEIADALPRYASHLHRDVSLHRRKGDYQLTMSHAIIKAPAPPAQSTPSAPHISPVVVNTANWRHSVSIHAPTPQRANFMPGFVSTTSTADDEMPPGFRYLIHPADDPPAAADGLPTLGLLHTESPAPEQEVRQVPIGTGRRYDTPALPLLLMDTLPPLRAADTVTPPASPDPTPPPPSDSEDDEMDTSSSDDDMEGASPSAPIVPGATALSPVMRKINDILERINYNSRTSELAALDKVPQPVYVFNAFTTPDAADSSDRSTTATPVVIDKGQPPNAPFTRVRSLPEVTTLADPDVELATVPPNSPLTEPEDDGRLAPLGLFDPFSDSEEENVSCNEDEYRLPPNESRTDELPLPNLGSTKRGPLVTREHYSSSPSFEHQRWDEMFEEGDAQKSHPFEAKPSPEEVRAMFMQTKAELTVNLEQANSEEDAEGVSDDESMPELMEPDSGSEDGRIDSPEPYAPAFSHEARITNNSGSFDISREYPFVPTTVVNEHQFSQLLNRNLDRLQQPAYAPTTSDYVRLGRTKLWVEKHIYELSSIKNNEINTAAKPLQDFLQIIFAHADILLETGQLPEGLVPVTQEEMEKISIPTHDGLYRVTSNSVLPRLEGRIFRKFGLTERDVMLLAAVSVAVQRRFGAVACLSLGRICLTDYVAGATELILRHGWPLDTSTCFHPLPAASLPCLDTDEKLQFRAVNHTLALHGFTAVSSLGDAVMRLQFREPTLVAHLLQHNMLTPATKDGEGVFDEPSVDDVAMNLPQASFSFRYPRSQTDQPPFQIVDRGDNTRLVQSYDTAARDPSAPHVASSSNTGHLRLPTPVSAPRGYFRPGYHGRSLPSTAPVNPQARVPRE
ncbi:hypothetical protein DFH06DRAFT_1147999 [Mycena polygramma]|nr:hypothetical protein DFH06DRAFT_1147999 [Mycena polygramma]